MRGHVIWAAISAAGGGINLFLVVVGAGVLGLNCFAAGCCASACLHFIHQALEAKLAECRRMLDEARAREASAA